MFTTPSMSTLPQLRFLAPCLLLTLVSAAPGQTQRPISIHDRAALHTALDAYDQGNLKAAEPTLRDLATRYPQNFEANEALGSLYAESGDAQRALSYLEHAAAIAPRQAIARANLGAAYLKLNNDEDAVRELRSAATLDPRNVHTQSYLGQALLRAHQPTAAAKAFAAASSLEPADDDIKYNRALALFESNALPEAAAVLESILTMNAPTHALAGDVDEKLGHYQAAVQHYQSAARLDPSAPNVYNLTLELLRHWSWGEAQQVAAYGSTHFPEDARFIVAQGIALYADGKYSKAADFFSTLMAHDPNNDMYADLLGRSCAAAGDDLGAHCGDLEQFAETHPGNARIATFAAARILQAPLEAQDTARAERLLHQAIQADPQLADAYFELGVLAQQKLEWQQSASALEKAIALRPSYAEAHYRLSRAYAHLGKREEAQQQIALQQQYAQQEKDALNTRMQEVVTFLLKPS